MQRASDQSEDENASAPRSRASTSIGSIPVSQARAVEVQTGAERKDGLHDVGGSSVHQPMRHCLLRAWALTSFSLPPNSFQIPPPSPQKAALHYTRANKSLSEQKQGFVKFQYCP